MSWLLERIRLRSSAGATAAAATPSARPTASRATAAAAPRPSAIAAAATTAPVAPPSSSSSTTGPTVPTEACRATLVGNAREVPGPIPLPSSAIQGKLPTWLKGALLANGPGDSKGMVHLFDGLASVARVGLDGSSDNGAATFTQRMLKTRAYERKTATGKLAYREFATAPPPPSPGFVGEARALFSQLAMLASGEPEFTDNASVNLIPVSVPSQQQGGKKQRQLLAMSETPAASYLLDALTLETLSCAAPDAKADGVPGTLTTAHPASLRGGREIVNFTRTLPFGGMHVYRMSTGSGSGDKKEGDETSKEDEEAPPLVRRPVAFIPDRHPMTPSWVHDFVATDDWAVIVEPPIYMNLASLTLGGDRKGLGQSDYVFMDWKPEEGVRVALVPLSASARALSSASSASSASASSGASSSSPSDPSAVAGASSLAQPRYFLIPQAFFAFHFGNCFVVDGNDDEEEEGEGDNGSSTNTNKGPRLCVDIAAYDDPAILNDLRLAPLLAGGKPLGDTRGGYGPGGRSGEVSPSRYVRLTIPLSGPSSGALSTPSSPQPLAPPLPLTKSGDLHADFCEFPTLNPRYRGKAQSRYAYVLNAVRPTNMGNALAKIDLRTGLSKTWREPGGAPGEPVFVARPGSAEEDDGVVMAFVAAPEGGSFVVVLDAKEWGEVARVRLPAAVPYRFHGGWLPDEDEE